MQVKIFDKKSKPNYVELLRRQPSHDHVASIFDVYTFGSGVFIVGDYLRHPLKDLLHVHLSMCEEDIKMIAKSVRISDDDCNLH